LIGENLNKIEFEILSVLNFQLSALDDLPLSLIAKFVKQISSIKRENQVDEIIYKQFFRVAQKALIEIYSGGLIETHKTVLMAACATWQAHYILSCFKVPPQSKVKFENSE